MDCFKRALEVLSSKSDVDILKDAPDVRALVAEVISSLKEQGFSELQGHSEHLNSQECLHFSSVPLIGDQSIVITLFLTHGYLTSMNVVLKNLDHERFNTDGYNVRVLTPKECEDILDKVIEVSKLVRESTQFTTTIDTNVKTIMTLTQTLNTKLTPLVKEENESNPHYVYVKTLLNKIPMTIKAAYGLPTLVQRHAIDSTKAAYHYTRESLSSIAPPVTLQQTESTKPETRILVESAGIPES